MDIKRLPITKLLWVDLEMTGLNPDKDVILEIAAQVTDFDFNVIDSYEARIKYEPSYLKKLFAANEFYSKDFPENREYFLNNLVTAKPPETVETELVDFVSKNFGKEPAVLAGNSIHYDRRFIVKYWPKFEKKLHYRMLDVSSWKLIMENKFNVHFAKRELHKAFSDIEESREELKFYLSWFGEGSELSQEEE